MKYSCKVPVGKLIFSALFFACFSCTDSEKVLTEAEKLIERQQPDSAFRLLNSILFPEDLKEGMYHKYNLLMITAKDKSGRNTSEDTTIIVDAKKFFARKKNFPDAAAAAFYSGRVFYEKGNTPKALLEYREAETFAENIDNDNLKGLIQGNLGILFHGQHIYDKSISRGKKAIEMYRKAQNYKNEISAICLIGDCFLLEKEIDSAFLYYNKSVKLADDHKIPELQVGARQNISVAFRKTEKYAIAKKYLTEALTFEIDSMEKARIFMNFSKIYTLENNIDSAKFYINKSLELKIKERTLLRSIYFSLSKIAEQEGNYAEALKHFNKYNEYVAQVVAENMSSALLECNEKYDFVKLKTKAYELAITRRGVINSVLLFVIVIIVIAFVFYRKLEKIQKKILEKEQKFETLQMMYDNLQRGEETVKNIIFKQYNMLIEIALLEKNLNPNKANDKEYMLKKLNLIIYKDEKVDFEPLYELMNQIQNDFYEKVRAKYGKLLTKQEFRVCCFTCEKFADSEISIFLNMTVYMVRKRRHDIKKKLNIPDGVDIYSFLIEDMKT